MIYFFVSFLAGLAVYVLYRVFNHKAIVPEAKFFKWKRDEEEEAYEEATRILRRPRTRTRRRDSI